MKKHYVAIIMVCLHFSTYSMDAAWKKWVEFRNPLDVAAFNENKLLQTYHTALNTAGNKSTIPTEEQQLMLLLTKKKLHNMIQNEVEQNYKTPWYVRWGSYVSPRESKSDQVKRAYTTLQKAFENTFYPVKKKDGILKKRAYWEYAEGNLSREYQIAVGELDQAFRLALLPEVENTVTGFKALTKKITPQITHAKTIVKDLDQLKRFDELSSLIAVLNKEVDQQPELKILLWDKARAVERVQKYFNVKV